MKKAIMLVLVSLLSTTAWSAEQYPTRPIRVVVPFPPGAASDFLARVVGARMAETYGQQVVIDNRPGAGGLIGSQIVAKSAPDGYNLALVGQPHHSNALIRDPRPYEPIKDYTSITMVAVIPNVIVLGTGVSVNTLKDFLALARAKPGQFNYGSAGVGSSSHLAGEMFVAAAGIKAVHIPFKSLGDVFAEMLQGRVHFYVFPLPAAMPMLREGKLRPIATATPKRAAALPNVPTTAEAGLPEYQSESWFGYVAPAGLPKPLLAKLNADFGKILAQKDIQDRFLQQGAVAAHGTPEAFHKLQVSEFERLAKMIKELGIRVQ